MINSNEAMKKFKERSEEWKQAIKDKNWKRAKIIYQSALSAAVFMELDEDEYSLVWGNGPFIPDSEIEVPGFFDRDLVMKMSEECWKLGIETIKMPIKIFGI